MKSSIDELGEFSRELAPGSNPTHAGRAKRVSAQRSDRRERQTCFSFFLSWLATLACVFTTSAILNAAPAAAEEPAPQHAPDTTAAATAAAASTPASTPTPAPTPAIEAATPAPARVEQSLLLSYLADKTVFTLVDARSPEEFLASHVDGAINLPLDRVAAENPALPAAHDEPIVVYCKTGKRAAAVAQALAALGYANVRVLPSEQLMFHDDLVIFNCSG